MQSTDISAPMSGSESPASDQGEAAHDQSILAVMLGKVSLARVLTYSEGETQAKVLLTPDSRSGNAGGVESGKKGLLKLTLQPFYRDSFKYVPSTPSNTTPATKNEEGEGVVPSSEEQQSGSTASSAGSDPVLHSVSNDEKLHSQRLLDVLKGFDWGMTGESCAEYSCYDGYPKPMPVDETLPPAAKKVKMNPVFKAEFIYPASEHQVAQATASPESQRGFAMFTETPAMYQTVTRPCIDEIVDSGSFAWIENIIQGREGRERVLLDVSENGGNNQDWILNVDTKWSSHPDPKTFPRQKWHKHESTANLRCLGIFKEKGIASLRDLRGKHLPVLRDMLDRGPRTIEEIYGVPKDQLRIFVHYQPEFYHFHVHFTRLEDDQGAQVERAHMLADVIQNLEADPGHYQKRSLTFKLGLEEKLCVLLKAHIDGESNGSAQKGTARAAADGGRECN